MLTEQETREIESEAAVYPRRDAACIDALKIVQKHRRWIDDQSVRDIAEFLNMPSDEVESVATFYNLPLGPEIPNPTYILCNADEMEPGTFKDRLLMERDPHQLIEGMICGAFAIEADVAYIFLRGE